MYKEYFHGFQEWISGGLSASAFALFLAASQLQNGYNTFQLFSIHASLASLPLLLFACALTREIRIKKLASETANKMLGCLFILGTSLFILSIMFLSLAFGHYLFGTLLVSMCVSLFLYVKAWPKN